MAHGQHARVFCGSPVTEPRCPPRALRWGWRGRMPTEHATIRDEARRESAKHIPWLKHEVTLQRPTGASQAPSASIPRKARSGPYVSGAAPCSVLPIRPMALSCARVADTRGRVRIFNSPIERKVASRWRGVDWSFSRSGAASVSPKVSASPNSSANLAPGMAPTRSPSSLCARWLPGQGELWRAEVGNGG